MISPHEEARIRRDLRRQQLLRERAMTRLAQLNKGPRPKERNKAELKALEQCLKVATLEQEMATKLFRAERTLAHKQRHENHMRRRLERYLRYEQNLELRAPGHGIVRYRKIWNSGVFSKVNVGSMVGSRFVLMRIADAREMFIRAEMPERYYAQVTNGMPVTVRIPSLTDAVLDGAVTEREFLFENKRRKDTKGGLYASHEPLGETVFYARVHVPEQQGVRFKPGAVAEVVFPFEK